MSSGAFGRPPHDRDFQRQYARKPARCQRRTVSGLRILSASSALGEKRKSPTNSSRSILPTATRFGDFRLCLRSMTVGTTPMICLRALRRLSKPEILPRAALPFLDKEDMGNFIEPFGAT